MHLQVSCGLSYTTDSCVNSKHRRAGAIKELNPHDQCSLCGSRQTEGPSVVTERHSN